MTEGVEPIVVPVSLTGAARDDAAKAVGEECFYLDEVIERVEVAGGAVTVWLRAEPVDRVALEEEVRAVADRIERSFRRVRPVVLAHLEGAGAYAADAAAALELRGDVRRSGPGVFTYQGAFLALMRRLDGVFAAMARDVGAVEQHYPSTVGSERLARAGYLRSFPHHALLVSACRRSGRAMRKLAASERPAEDHLELEGSERVLAPTVCYRCFEALAGRTHEVPMTFTGTAACHRREVGDARFPTAQNFTMREVVFIGEPAWADSMRMDLLARTQELVAAWGLAGAFVSALDPFVGGGGDAKRGFQSLMGKKYELRLRVPATGGSVAAASFNLHDASLVDPFEITGAGGEAVASSCVGFGLERFAYGVCAQFGIDEGGWPEPLRAAMAGSAS